MREGSVSIPDAIEIAAAHRRAGRLQQAERLCQRILTTRPHNADALHLLGVLSHQAGKNDMAVELIRKAIQSNPTKASFFTNLAVVLQMQGKLEEAVASYNRALEIEPNLADVHNKLGAALKDQGQLEAAVAAFRKALELKPDRAAAHNNLGVALKGQGKLDEAVTSYRRALKLKPDDPKIHYNLGAALKDQGKLDEAVVAYRRTLELKPDYAEAYYNLGVALKDQGKLREAATSYRGAIAIDPTYGEAQIGLSAILRSRGRLKDARTALSTAIRQKPLYTKPCTNQKKSLGSILRLVGAQNSYFVLGENFKNLFKPGNLPIEYLVDNSKFTIHEFYILDHNLSNHANDLPAFDLILNSIADPDTEPGPLDEADKFVTAQNFPFINNPQRVFSTSRDNVYKLLNGVENIIVPKTVKGELIQNDKSSLHSVLTRHNLRFPLLVRPLGSHAGEDLRKIDNGDDFAKIKISGSRNIFYFTEFHDCRSDDGYFRKIRLVFVNGMVFPQHLFISKGWNVHVNVRREFMKYNDWTMKEEEEFLENYPESFGHKISESLKDINSKVRLDFCGCDCAVLPSGELLIFEVNPAMGITFRENREDFRYKLRYTRKIINAFEEMIFAKVDNV